MLCQLSHRSIISGNSPERLDLAGVRQDAVNEKTLRHGGVCELTGSFASIFEV